MKIKYQPDTIWITAVPEIILGDVYFFRPLHTPRTHGVRDPLPSGQICESDPPPQDTFIYLLS